jgi:hypothetical protein
MVTGGSRVAKELAECRRVRGRTAMGAQTGRGAMGELREHGEMQVGMVLVARPAGTELGASQGARGRVRELVKRPVKQPWTGTVRGCGVSRPMGSVPFRVKHRSALLASEHAKAPSLLCEGTEPSIETAICRDRGIADGKALAKALHRATAVASGHTISPALET